MTSKGKFSGAYPIWTAEEDARLIEICAAASVQGIAAWRAVAEEFPGRSYFAVRQHYLTLRQKAAGVTRTRRKERPAPERSRQMPASVPSASTIPATEHLSLTAALCGDPLPGRSALDQKRCTQTNRRPITLAGAMA